MQKDCRGRGTHDIIPPVTGEKSRLGLRRRLNSNAIATEVQMTLHGLLELECPPFGVFPTGPGTGPPHRPAVGCRLTQRSQGFGQSNFYQL